MTINERIRQFRKDILHINQRQFASELGMAQTGISYMEQPNNKISDSSIKTICTMYNLNEDWLRTGSGSMYIQPPTFSLDSFIKERGADDMELDIIKAYFELDSDVRQKLVEHFKKKFSKSLNEEPPYDIFRDVPDTPEELERMYPPVEFKKKNNEAG